MPPLRVSQLASSSSSPATFFLPFQLCDAEDSSSEDGDTIQSPPPSHGGRYSGLFQHHNVQFSYGYPPQYTSPATQRKYAPTASTSCPSSLTSSSSATRATSSKFQQKYRPQHLSTPFTPPTKALDLANASLEMDPFMASFSAAMDYDTPHNPAGEGSFHLDSDVRSQGRPSLHRAPVTDYAPFTRGRMYSPQFPKEHHLEWTFVRKYELGDELGSGGYGFVMTARHRVHGYEVAVKFIIKSKVPDNAWMNDENLGRVPTEIMLLSMVNHEHIVRCVDIFEDHLYFYLVQELHGTPWVSRSQRGAKSKQSSAPGKMVAPPPSSPPALSPSASDTTIESMFLDTPPQSALDLRDLARADSPTSQRGDFAGGLDNASSLQFFPPLPLHHKHLDSLRPNFSRRPSHDLFECIEQSKHKRLSETQARYIFAQVVEAVWYLDRQGITHRDIKDENLLIDKDFTVKLIDFGSAVVADPTQPRPFYNLFYGTTAYAASEIILRQPYQAAPAEMWTLGVLLSYLLTGASPFPSERDAIEGRIVLNVHEGKAQKGIRVSEVCLGLMRRCLNKDPERRANIEEIRDHWWVRGAWEAWEGRMRR